MLRRGVICAALAAALLSAAPAAASPAKDAAAVQEGLAAAVDAGFVQPDEAARYLGIVGRAVLELPRLPTLRAANLAAVLSEVAAQAGSYTAPRALALFSMLDTNASYFDAHALPTRATDIAGPDGVVYRYFSGHGFEFHPLANFGALNADLAAGHESEAQALAAALVARAVPTGDALAWEYYFAFAGGPAPWTSGMAQAVGAQALARASQALGDQTLLQAASAAYHAIPGKLVRALPDGPWVLLYSFNRDVVLNAQLQAALSIGDYASIAGDPDAARLAIGLENAAVAMLARFDTGYWSLYSLVGDDSSLDYHQYVVSLLEKLAARTSRQGWAEAATRFQSYLTQPPAFELGDPVPPLFPRPADGFRDSALVSFWLSKPATVTLEVAGASRVLQLRDGWHALTWDPGSRPPGVYPVHLRAVDLAGNRAETDLLPIVVEADTRPPELSAQVTHGRLVWQAVDDGTPWLRLRLLLTNGAGSAVLDFGRRPLGGSLALDLPLGRWDAMLAAADSAGNVAKVSLGPVGA